MMNATQITPTQMHLLKLQDCLDAEADRLWYEGILNQDRLDQLRHQHLHVLCLTKQ